MGQIPFFDLPKIIKPSQSATVYHQKALIASRLHGLRFQKLLYNGPEEPFFVSLCFVAIQRIPRDTDVPTSKHQISLLPLHNEVGPVQPWSPLRSSLSSLIRKWEPPSVTELLELFQRSFPSYLQGTSDFSATKYKMASDNSRLLIFDARRRCYRTVNGKYLIWPPRYRLSRHQWVDSFNNNAELATLRMAVQSNSDTAIFLEHCRIHKQSFTDESFQRLKQRTSRSPTNVDKFMHGMRLNNLKERLAEMEKKQRQRENMRRYELMKVYLDNKRLLETGQLQSEEQLAEMEKEKRQSENMQRYRVLYEWQRDMEQLKADERRREQLENAWRGQGIGDDIGTGIRARACHRTAE